MATKWGAKMENRSETLASISTKLKDETDWILEQINLGKVAFPASTFCGYRRSFVNGLHCWPSKNKKLLTNLIAMGFKSLKDDDYWLQLEIFAYKYMKYEIAVAFTRSLFSLYKAFTSQHNMERVGTIHFGNKSVSLIDIYIHSMNLGKLLRKAFEVLKDDPTRTDGTKSNIAYDVICIIKKITSQRKCCNTLEAAYELSISEAHKNNISKTRAIAIKTNFLILMKLYNPSVYERDIIRIGRHKIDITSASKLSPVFKQQLEKISESNYMNGMHGHKIRANISRLHSNLRVLEHLCSTDETFSKCFREKGLDCLALNNFSLLKLISYKTTKRNANEIKRFYEIHSERNLSKSVLNEHILSFPNHHSGQTRNIDVTSLLQFGKRFYEDVIKLHKSEILLNTQKNYGIETLYSRFAVLMKMAKLINKKSAIKHGIRFLSESDGKYQIELLCKAQAECLSKSISRRTAEAIFSCVRWICQITNQKFINAYRITSNRHAIHAARLSTKDTYSLDEVRELAFYIEKSITIDAGSSKNLLALYFAKIQIKTCLNTASLITVECADIKEIDIPTKDKPITVLIQKPRKGYKTDYFNFDPKFPKSAIHDLLYVRDQLTSTVRTKFSSNALSKRLFIHEEVGQLKSLTNTNTVPHIAQFLLNAGCTVKYNSAKLRKTGANEIYRQLAKDISRYKDALKHSYATFVKHYQRINEAKQKLNLQNATETMDKYFTGKEISSEIKIVTEYSKSTQLTPLGGCTSKAGSKEAVSYKKAHASLDSSAPLRCGDFLACVWCKYYRVVADASHIWQLLTFKKFVLSSMSSSVAHFSDASTQKQAIEALNYRVDSIVNTIKSINYSAVHEGETLMQTKGMHPDWEFAFPALGLTP